MWQNFDSCTKANIDAGQAGMNTVPGPQYVLLPFLTSDSQGPKSSEDEFVNDAEGRYANALHRLNTVSSQLLVLADDENVGAEADLNNLETTMNVSPIPTTRIHKDHPKDQIIGDIILAIQTRKMTKISEENAMVNYINKQRRTNHKDYQNCLFAYFLSQKEPKKVIQALENPSWIEAMQEELLQFKLQKVWTLVDLPKGKHAIGTKWVYKNKKDERGIVMDVKSAFLYGAIEEEVYVCHPPSFEDPQFPDKVYKVEKDLYGLHQAPRAWKGKRTTKISQSSRPIHLDADETIYKEWEDIMERAATTASSLEAEQNRTDSGVDLGPSYHIGDAEAQTRFEAASKQSNDPPLLRVNTLRSGEDNMKLKELTELCTKLFDIVSKKKREKCE
ncbi:putative ribonuclease H-like domain-containing protein [Tanacetum coccineum]